MSAGALDYFLDYVRYATTSDEESTSWPSTPGQRVLAERLAEDLRALGLEAEVDENGYVMGRLPGNRASGPEALRLGFVAHMDTAPDFNGADVRPRLVRYEGRPIPLDEEGQYCLSEALFPALARLRGKTLVVTDGRSLLGADNKAGIAAIMGLLAAFKERPELPHGPICVAFTPDEEVGRGAHRFDVAAFGADVAYTIDGGERGELECENFNAAAAKIRFLGRSVHPGGAKGQKINAALLARDFANQLDDGDTPQATEGYEGFFHLCDMKGSVEEAQLSYIIRDFDEAAFAGRKARLEQIAAQMNARLDRERVFVELKEQYRNMKSVIDRHPYLLALAEEAMREEGVKPLLKPIRGGTDGSQLSFKGLPCPNIYTGGGNFHGRFEYLCVEDFEELVRVLIRLCAKFCGRERQT